MARLQRRESDRQIADISNLVRIIFRFICIFAGSKIVKTYKTNRAPINCVKLAVVEIDFDVSRPNALFFEQIAGSMHIHVSY